MDVLLVDDHPILHETLRAVVSSVAPEAQFHGETSLGGGVSKARQLKDLQLVLLDLLLPRKSGYEVIPELAKVAPDARVLVVSSQAAPRSVRPALSAGAAGYLPKRISDRELIAAITQVAGGHG